MSTSTACFRAKTGNEECRRGNRARFGLTHLASGPQR